jgi:hypothetical protein
MKVFKFFAAHSASRRAVLAVGLLTGLSGCATLASDDHQSIVVTSDPVGATCNVRAGGDFVAQVPLTPGTVLVHKSRHDIAIDCVKPGYFPGAAVLEPRFNEWVWGNLIYGGNLGMLVDTASGAFNNYPTWVSVLMRRQTFPGQRLSESERIEQQDDERRHVIREMFRE